MSRNRRESMMSNETRAKYGCTTTWKNADGELLTVTRVGRPLTVLGDVADEVTARDPSYRLVSYSTPETILTDLQGHRVQPKRAGYAIDFPERNALGRINRRDLIATDLEAHEPYEAGVRRANREKARRRGVRRT